jgi:uncharacterized protein
MSMTVGILTFELHLPASHGLKEKRKVVKGLVDRLHARYRVSVAETDYHDLHQRAEIGVSVVAGGRGGPGEVEQMLLNLREAVDAATEQAYSSVMITRWDTQVLEAE